MGESGAAVKEKERRKALHLDENALARETRKRRAANKKKKEKCH